MLIAMPQATPNHMNMPKNIDIIKSRFHLKVVECPMRIESLYTSNELTTYTPKRKREKEKESEYVSLCACVCMCMCVTKTNQSSYVWYNIVIRNEVSKPSSNLG